MSTCSRARAQAPSRLSVNALNFMLTVSDKPSDAGPGYTTSPGHCLCPEPTVGGPTLPHLNWDPVRECTRFQSPTLPVGSALSDCSPFREEGGTMRLRQHPQEPEFSRGNVALAQEPSSALTPGFQLLAVQWSRREDQSTGTRIGLGGTVHQLSFQPATLQSHRGRSGTPLSCRAPGSQASSLFFLSYSCWDMNDNTALWWVIKGPVVGSIMVSVLGTRSRREREVWAERSGRGEIKWSPHKPTSLFTAVLCSATWMSKLFSYFTGVGHLSLFHFTLLWKMLL